METTADVAELADCVVDLSYRMSMVATGVIGFHIESEGRPPDPEHILVTLAELLEMAFADLPVGWSGAELRQGSALLRAASTLVQDGILDGGVLRGRE